MRTFSIFQYLSHFLEEKSGEAFAIFSSPEAKAQVSYCYRSSSVGVRPSTFSNNFSSEAAGPIVTKHHSYGPWVMPFQI